MLWVLLNPRVFRFSPLLLLLPLCGDWRGTFPSVPPSEGTKPRQKRETRARSHYPFSKILCSDFWATKYLSGGLGEAWWAVVSRSSQERGLHINYHFLFVCHLSSNWALCSPRMPWDSSRGLCGPVRQSIISVSLLTCRTFLKANIYFPFDCL